MRKSKIQSVHFCIFVTRIRINGRECNFGR